MANTRLMQTFLNYTPSATSVNTSFPASNLELYTHPFRPWKALVSTGVVDVTFDFGLGNTVSGLAANPGIYIGPTNLTSLQIQGNTSLSWATPPWDESITVAQWRRTKRYQDFRRLADLDVAAFGYRYLNIRIPSQTTTDGAVYRIGSVLVGTITELSVNPRASVRRVGRDHVISVDFLDGGRELLDMGEPAMEFVWPRVLVGTSQLHEALDLDALGLSVPFVAWDSILGGPEHAWLVRRIDDASLEQSFPGLHEGDLAMREVT